MSNNIVQDDLIPLLVLFIVNYLFPGWENLFLDLEFFNLFFLCRRWLYTKPTLFKKLPLESFITSYGLHHILLLLRVILFELQDIPEMINWLYWIFHFPLIIDYAKDIWKFNINQSNPLCFQSLKRVHKWKTFTLSVALYIITLLCDHSIILILLLEEKIQLTLIQNLVACVVIFNHE